MGLVGWTLNAFITVMGVVELLGVQSCIESLDSIHFSS